MKIYLAHSTKFDYQQELYIPLQESILEKQHDFVYFLADGKQGQSSKEVIKEADLLIAEISYPSLGVGIELGWADAFEVPIICVFKQGIDYSQYLQVVADQFISYIDSKDLIAKLTFILTTDK